MKYFSNFPKIVLTDNAGQSTIYTNILERVSLIPDLQKNPLVFYTYDLQEGDTPEIVASKYYEDPYRYWMFLYGNPQIMDPQWDLPLDSNVFESYLRDKYTDAAVANNQTFLEYTQSTIYNYQKVVKTYDSISQTENVEIYNVSHQDYLNAFAEGTKTKTFPDGSYVTVTVTPQIFTIYDYENQLNESKRNVGIINTLYADDLEHQLQSLLST